MQPSLLRNMTGVRLASIWGRVSRAVLKVPRRVLTLLIGPTQCARALSYGLGVGARDHIDDAGMANGVWYYDQDGAEQFQQAAVVILATNGVGTPRLMLNSKSERFPDGLANSSGLVGKNLMFHPYAMIRGVFPEALDGHRGPEPVSGVRNSTRRI
ncbi:MAG: hypothetical protein CM15mP120_00230 [Pseudomonadota bacterium]|nr:MAG: hypothetical protein CM15mP120_00230 [Pseudomonadota bacterium]